MKKIYDIETQSLITLCCQGVPAVKKEISA